LKPLHLIATLATVFSTCLTALAALAAPSEDHLTLVLDWSINTNHTGVVAADKLGYFAEEEIKLNLEAPPQIGAAALVAGGSAQMAFSYQEEVTFARSQGLPLVAIAAVIQHNSSGLAARTESGISRPREISGRRYGGWGGEVELAVLKALVEGDGGDFASIETIPIGATDFFAATRSHIDVIWIYEGWDGIAAGLKGIKLNYMPIASIPELDYYTPLLVTSEDAIDTDPELLQRALRAISRGYVFAMAEPEKAAAFLLEHAPELDARLVHASQQFLATRYQAEAPRWGEMKSNVWKGFADWLTERNLLKGEFNPHAAFTNRFLPRAQ